MLLWYVLVFILFQCLQQKRDQSSRLKEICNTVVSFEIKTTFAAPMILEQNRMQRLIALGKFPHDPTGLYEMISSTVHSKALSRAIYGLLAWAPLRRRPPLLWSRFLVEVLQNTFCSQSIIIQLPRIFNNQLEWERHSIASALPPLFQVWIPFVLILSWRPEFY